MSKYLPRKIYTEIFMSEQIMYMVATCLSSNKLFIESFFVFRIVRTVFRYQWFWSIIMSQQVLTIGI